MENKSARIGIFAIIACMLIIQSAQFSYSEDDPRKTQEELTKKIQLQINDLKTDLKNKKNIWEVAKNSTDTTKITYKQNPTVQNLSALNLAKKTESDTYQNYLKALKLLQDFKPDLEQKVIEKAEKNNEVSKSKIIIEEISTEAEKIAQDLVNAAKTFSESKKLALKAKLTYLRDSTPINLSLMNQALQKEKTDELNYFKAVNATKDFEANSESTKLISTKQLSDSISDERIKANSLSKEIQKDLNLLKQNLKDSDNKWTVSKDATELNKDTYRQNPTQKNLNLLNEAKKKETEEYQNYLDALKQVREFKPDLNEKIIEKAVVNTEAKISNTVEKAIDASAASIQAKLESAAKDVENTSKKLSVAKWWAKEASKIYLLESTTENENQLWEARKAEAEALFFYTKAVDALEDVKKTN